MSKLKGVKILVIDDEDLIREILVDMFSIEGAEISEAPNGKIGLEKLSKETYDVVVCDYRMPGLDGLGVADAIKERVASKPLVFLCTGQTEVQTSDVAPHGVTGLFYKPFQSATMINNLVSALSKTAGT